MFIFLAIRNIFLATNKASSLSGKKLPVPVLQSMTKASVPAANFPHIIEAAVNSIDSTVPDTSLKEYIFLSAGHKSPDKPTIAVPCFVTILWKSSLENSHLNPLIDSNLSKVPPVWPKVLPEVKGTVPPHAATIATKGIEHLSPIPPVECLSNFMPGISEKSNV